MRGRVGEGFFVGEGGAGFVGTSDIDEGKGMGGGFDSGDEQVPDVLQMRRRDWTPWEFERACRNLAHRLQAQVRRVETGPVEQREVVAG